MNVIQQEISEKFSIYNGDSCEVIKGIPDRSIHYTIFSPPFASLYTYSNSDRDLGNCRSYDDFFRHFQYLVSEMLRITIPGRLLSFHCMLLPTSKQIHGYIGLQDFRGELIRAFVAAGWIHHSEVVIWKDPVTAMQRTKALGLLHKTVRENSSMARQGIPDYLITMRAPGEVAQEDRVKHKGASRSDGYDVPGGDYPVSLWQRIASPVWMDIDPSDTLQRESAREDDDERHICPLQLEVIRRGVRLWTNPGDIVFSPFGGIGSEGYVAIQEGRRAILCELKESYYKQAVLNLQSAVGAVQQELFA